MVVVANIIICTSAVIGYICNGTLIYLIRRNPHSRLGNYRYLLLLLAIFNCFYATDHLVVIPVEFAHKYGVVLYASSFLGQYKLVSYMGLIAHCSLFAQSTILLAYHFIYRYACICKTEWLRVINSEKGIYIGIVYYVTYVTTWSSMIHLFLGPTLEYFDRIAEGFYRFTGRWPNETGVLGDNYFIDNGGSLRFNVRPWICLGVCMTLMSAMFCVILYWGWSMHKKLNTTEMMSDRRYRLQKQLFQCLIVQFIVPIILEYIPCTALFLMPMTGQDVDLEVFTIAISFYAVFEPIVVIYFVREYRVALFALLLGKKPRSLAKISSIQAICNNSVQRDSKPTSRTDI